MRRLREGLHSKQSTNSFNNSSYIRKFQHGPKDSVQNFDQKSRNCTAQFPSPCCWIMHNWSSFYKITGRFRQNISFAQCRIAKTWSPGISLLKSGDDWRFHTCWRRRCSLVPSQSCRCCLGRIVLSGSWVRGSTDIFFIIAWIVTSGKNLRNESSHSMNGRKVRSNCPTRIWSMHNIKEIAQQLICINSTLWGPNVCLTCKSTTNNTNRPSSIEAAKFLGLFQNFSAHVS